MGKLYFIGAGGFAREVYSYIREGNCSVDGYELEGFLSDYKSDLNGYDIEYQIVDDMFSNRLSKSDAILIAVSDCNLKEKIYDYYSSLNVEILTYIHPSAIVGKDVSVGKGTVVCPSVILTCDIQVGVCATINAHTSIGHDAKLGDFCTLSGHCDVTGFVNLGSKVFMGSHAAIIPHVKIGDGAVIGAGSVIISKVKPGVTMFGNPAKKIK